MIFGGQRSPKTTALVVGAVIFLAAFIGLVYNHLDAWELPSKFVPPQLTHSRLQEPLADRFVLHRSSSRPDMPVDDVDAPLGLDKSKGDQTSSNKDFDEDAAARDFFMKAAQKSYIDVDAKKYAPHGAFGWELPSQGKWTKPMGENLCIIDLDDRPFSEPHQLFGPNVMSWDNADKLHGLSLGVLNHWLYGTLQRIPLVAPAIRAQPSPQARSPLTLPQPRSTATSTTTSRLTPSRTVAPRGRSLPSCRRFSRSTMPASTSTRTPSSTTSIFPSSGS